MNASYAYNNAVDVWDSGAADEDPTCVVAQCPGRQIYAPTAGGSGIDNVYINTKWLVKASGTVQLPYPVNLGANFTARQGYPFPQAILTPNPNSGGQASVLVDAVGDNRLPTFTPVDLRVDRNFTFGRIQLKPTFDVFNVMTPTPCSRAGHCRPRASRTTSAGSWRRVWRASRCNCAGSRF
jgi:hypothetical protein